MNKRVIRLVVVISILVPLIAITMLGCAPKKPAVPAPPAPPVAPVKPEVSRYYNKDKGFSIELPKEWEAICNYMKS